MARRTHSTIDTLPASLKSAVNRMLIDDEFPDDWTGEEMHRPTYDDVVEYLKSKGTRISRSAVGRYGMRMRTLARMKRAGAITREIMADLTNEKASQTQKAVAEMITAVAIEFVSGREDFDAEDIRDVAKAMKDCTAIAISSDKYVRTQLEEKTKEADKNVTEIAKKKNIDPETLRMIREQIYGIRS